MTITLESIKTEQSKLAQMIAKIEEDMKKPAFFEYQGKRIPMEHGEQYVGTIISADGSRNHHIILLPDEVEKKTWHAAMEWAASIGGELPTREEQEVLFNNCKEQFQRGGYWSNEQHASYSYFAWFQYFYYGNQLSYDKSSEFRARAVRRLKIL